jgi:FtsZ-binding cell division protein ZapB
MERIDRAIDTVAQMMVKHDMPDLIVTIRRLEAERDSLRQETRAMDYAKEILRKRAQQRTQHDKPIIALTS